MQDTGQIPTREFSMQEKPLHTNTSPDKYTGTTGCFIDLIRASLAALARSTTQLKLMCFSSKDATIALIANKLLWHDHGTRP